MARNSNADLLLRPLLVQHCLLVTLTIALVLPAGGCAQQVSWRAQNAQEPACRAAQPPLATGSASHSTHPADAAPLRPRKGVRIRSRAGPGGFAGRCRTRPDGRQDARHRGAEPTSRATRQTLLDRTERHWTYTARRWRIRIITCSIPLTIDSATRTTRNFAVPATFTMELWKRPYGWCRNRTTYCLANRWNWKRALDNWSCRLSLEDLGLLRSSRTWNSYRTIRSRA